MQLLSHPLSLICILLLCCSLGCNLDAAVNKKKKKRFKSYPPEQHLAQMPDSDPAPSLQLSVSQQMRGVHPRLLMSREDFAAVMQRAENDELLKRYVDNTLAQAAELGVNKKALNKIFHGASAAVVHALGRYPNLIFAHGLQPTGESKQKVIDLLTILVEEPHWDYGYEMDYGMGASCVMLLAGLSFDMICDDLDPAFRKQAAQKLFTHARRMYYLGHREKGLHKVRYWQQDPANNHRWFRNKGIAACLLAVADEDGVDAGWMLQEFKKEMDYVMRWYPQSGDCHEGVTYSHFGFAHLAFSVTMMDRIIGTEYSSSHQGLRNAWELMVYAWSPSRHGMLSFGDSRNRAARNWGKHGAFYIGPKLSRDANAQAALQTMHRNLVENKDLDANGWMTLCFYDPTLEPGNINELPPNHLFPDLGVAYMRESWDAASPLLMFKCGPYGGYALNEYRHSENDMKYISVAHDDPDANSFSLILDGQLIAHPGTYNMPKLSSHQNTLLVNGKGQIGEGGGWLQPVKGTDMRSLSYLTSWQYDQDSGQAMIEGEAGNAYPDLARFRRSMLWMPGKYILILDDIACTGGPQDIAWTCNAPDAGIVDAASGRGHLIGESGAQVNYQICANQAISGVVSEYILTSPKGNEAVKKSSWSVKADAVRFACILNPWQDQSLDIQMQDNGSSCSITVSGNGFSDVWTWKPAGDLETPARINCVRDGNVIASLSSSDKAPHGDGQD